MTSPPSSRAAVPSWSTPIEACRLIARGVTVRTCPRVAVVVGTILTVVNRSSVIADGDTSAATWARVGVDYLVPFVVSSIGYLPPFRHRDGTIHPEV